MNLVCKVFSNDFSPYQFLLFRSLPGVFICIYLMRIKKISFWGNNKKYLLLRAFTGALSAYFFFKAIAILPIGMSIILKNLEPFFALILSFFFFKYKFNWVHFYSIVLALVGIIIVLANTESFSELGMLYMIISSIIGGFAIIYISKLSTSDSPITIIFYLSIFCSFMGAYSLFDWQSVEPHLYGYLLLVGILNFLAQLFLTLAFQIGDPRNIAPIKYVEIFLAMLIGSSLLGESYIAYNYIGAFIFVLALVVNIIDFNNDGKINLKDFDYLMSFDKNKLDLNKDGKINLKDLFFLFRKN